MALLLRGCYDDDTRRKFTFQAPFAEHFLVSEVDGCSWAQHFMRIMFTIACLGPQQDLTLSFQWDMVSDAISSSNFSLHSLFIYRLGWFILNVASTWLWTAASSMDP